MLHGLQGIVICVAVVLMIVYLVWYWIDLKKYHNGNNNAD
jgi:hypothetical protein